MHHLRLALAFLIVVRSASFADVLATSPDRKMEVRRTVVGEDTSGGIRQKIEIVAVPANKVLYSWKSVRRSTDAEWSPDGMLLFVNDRIANSGDYLYLFRTTPTRVVRLRKPDDESLWRDLQRRHPSFVEFEHISISGVEWTGNRTLEVRCWGEFATSSKEAKLFHYSPFRLTWDVSVTDRGTVRVENERQLPIE